MKRAAGRHGEDEEDEDALGMTQDEKSLHACPSASRDRENVPSLKDCHEGFSSNLEHAGNPPTDDSSLPSYKAYTETKVKQTPLPKDTGDVQMLLSCQNSATASTSVDPSVYQSRPDQSTFKKTPAPIAKVDSNSLFMSAVAISPNGLTLIENDGFSSVAMYQDSSEASKLREVRDRISTNVNVDNQRMNDNAYLAAAEENHELNDTSIRSYKNQSIGSRNCQGDQRMNPGAVAIEGIGRSDNESATPLYDNENPQQALTEETRSIACLSSADISSSTVNGNHQGLAVAVAIIDDEEVNYLNHECVPIEKSIEDNDSHESFEMKERRIRHSCCIILTAIIIIGLVLGIILGIDKKETMKGVCDVFLRNESFRTTQIVKQIQREGLDYNNLLCTPGTAQNEAVLWLAAEDKAQIDFSNTETMIQRYILSVLYYSTGGRGWTNSCNFLSANNECEWSKNGTGILNCTEDGLVTEFSLGSNNITGEIPPEIGHLISLKIFHLVGNADLRGTIPSTIGNLSQLKNLLLSETSLSGIIPSEIGDLTFLTSLSLQYNALIGTIPHEMGKLTNLETLYLKDNDIVGTIPTTFSNLAALTKVDVSFNKFFGDTESICGIEGISLESFFADCLESLVPAINLEIACPCCTHCCSEANGEICIPQ